MPLPKEPSKATNDIFIKMKGPKAFIGNTAYQTRKFIYGIMLKVLSILYTIHISMIVVLFQSQEAKYQFKTLQ